MRVVEHIKKIPKAVLDILLLLAMWIVGVFVAFREVRGRSYTPQAVPKYPMDHDQVKILFDVSESASAHTDDKIKQLLTVSSSLATFVAVFSRATEPRWLGAVVVWLLLMAVVLCLSAFEVRREMVPVPEDKDSDTNHVAWARDLLKSCYANRASHFFRVDQYRAATRYFMLALLCTLGLALIHKTGDPLTDLTATVHRIEERGLVTRPVQSLPTVDTTSVRKIPGPSPAGHHHAGRRHRKRGN